MRDKSDGYGRNKTCKIEGNLVGLQKFKAQGKTRHQDDSGQQPYKQREESKAVSTAFKTNGGERLRGRRPRENLAEGVEFEEFCFGEVAPFLTSRSRNKARCACGPPKAVMASTKMSLRKIRVRRRSKALFRIKN